MTRAVPAILLTLSLLACGSESGGDNDHSATETAPSIGLRNERHPFPEVISGGQPTPTQLRAAKDKGFETVINLRAAGEPGVAEEKAEVEGLGMHYVWIPVRGAEGITVENAKAMMAALSKSKGPTLLHCASGNRVGALFAMNAFHVDGKPATEALRIGKAAGMTRLAPLVKQKLHR
jgi:uncharacterized protein (TIGR01244 family)